MATAKAKASFLLFARHWLYKHRQIGVYPGIPPRSPANLIYGSRSLASKAARCKEPSISTSVRLCSRDDGRCQEQEVLWQQFFLDPASWSDNRRHKKSSLSPDFRRKGSSDVLWLNDMFKPAWVDEQLVSLDMELCQGASPSKLGSLENREPGRRADSQMEPGSRRSSVRSPALPYLMGHSAYPSQSSSQDTPEPGRWAGTQTQVGIVTAAMVSALCKQGKLSRAVEALESLAQTDSSVSQSLFHTVLKLCTAKKDLVVGQRVHDLTIKLGYESSPYLGYHILRMYGCGGKLQEAMGVFTRVDKPDVFMWVSIISAYAKHGKPKEAIQLYHEMRRSGAKADAHVFVAALQACALATDLESGRKVHCDVVHSGIPINLFVGACLVDMYAKCGKMKDSRQVFDNMATKDVVVWNALIAGYVQQGLSEEAFSVYGQMEEAGLILANRVTFSCLLKACANTNALQEGKQLHSLIVKRGLSDNVMVGTCLVDMYAKCGSVEAARQVFDSMAIKDVVTWNAMIAGYAKQGLAQEALVAYGQMEEAGLIVADAVTFCCLLKAFGSSGALQKGRQLHSQIVKRGLLDNVVVGNCLVDMYAKCGELKDAQEVFNSMKTKDVVTWTTLMASYAQQGLGQEALDVYGQMEEAGHILADSVTFSCLLKACGSSGALQKGRQLHSQIEKRGLLDNVVVGTCLVDMYAKCGELEDAREVLNSMSTKDVVAWTALIAGYARQGLRQKALAVYGEMEQSGLILADGVTFCCLLRAFGSIGALQNGRHLHSLIVKRGLLDDVMVGTCLVDMYAKCGELEDAREVFDSMSTKDVVTWNALISGYAKCGKMKDVRQAFESMAAKDVDVVTWNALIAGYSKCGEMKDARQIFDSMATRDVDVVTWNALIAGYAKCGEMKDARQIFDSMAIKDKNVVTWNTLIAGYAQQGLAQEALVAYGQMEEAGLILADDVTFCCILKACGSSGALQKGRQLHSQIVRRGLLDNVLVANSLVNMYAKCGELEDARKVFNNMNTKDVVTWNALIAGYGDCDEGHKAMACFEGMLVAGIQPNDVTFTCLLVACSHAGLVEEGRKHFDSMTGQHGIKPSIQHYNCMIDLLGRSGQLDEAEKMLSSCKDQVNDVGLMSLLHACKSYRDIEGAERCFKSIVNLDPQMASAYVLMANAYADAGRWADVDRIEAQRRAAEAYKKPAVATIEVKKEVHRFVVGERSKEIAVQVESVNARLKQEGGHVPHTKLVLKPMCEKEKEDVLCGHAEKLALAFGLLNTPSGTPLVVTKNLRMCSDCHSSTEIMSQLEQRDIVVRDGYRVHRFTGGSCSCKGRP